MHILFLFYILAAMFITCKRDDDNIFHVLPFNTFLNIILN